MRIEQIRRSNTNTWLHVEPSFADKAQLVIAFGDSEPFSKPECYTELASVFKNANIVGCSSGGNALGTTLTDDDIVATAIQFEHAQVKVAVADVTAESDVQTLAHSLATQLKGDNLQHIFVLADGLATNGSQLADGLTSALGQHVEVTGGLAGDGTRFQRTWVMANGPAKSHQVVAIGLYGENLSIGTGCSAGWDEFGAERIITKSKGNIVYEIDGQPALDLYKKYLGPYVSELPGCAFRFPLSVRASEKDEAIIRSILGINEADSSLVFAGDIPQGYLAKLMKTNLDGLIDSAGVAAKAAKGGSSEQTLCLVVSCVGRRVVLQQLTEEELELIHDTLGKNTRLIGFYSYGELAPHNGEKKPCKLHNQTITLTTISE